MFFGQLSGYCAVEEEGMERGDINRSWIPIVYVNGTSSPLSM